MSIACTSCKCLTKKLLHFVSLRISLHHVFYTKNIVVYNNFRCIYQPDKSKSDPCQDFVKDPTKPIWNCLMAVTCRVLYQQKNFQEESQIVSEINNLMKNFFDRYRMEHEEESNFKINLFCEELGLKYLNHNHLKT